MIHTPEVLETLILIELPDAKGWPVLYDTFGPPTKTAAALAAMTVELPDPLVCWAVRARRF